jgi:histidine ammonia-lyase
MFLTEFHSNGENPLGDYLLPFQLSTQSLLSIAEGEDYPLSEELLLKLKESNDFLEQFLITPSKDLLYGIDTGFGPHAFQNNEDRVKNQESLILHLTVTSRYESISHVEARAVLAARLHSLLQGGSGISRNTIEILNNLLTLDCIPLIPERGSLSASGDLIPLSALGLALMGENEWSGKNKAMGPSPSNQKKSKIPGLPRILAPKEALSLTNGTSFTTALLAIQVEQSRKIIQLILNYLEILFSFHRVFPDAFLPALHETKKHRGPIEIANRLHPMISKNPKQKVEGKKIQDIYSIRCIPQILGAILDELDGIKTTTENELNSLSDNPVYVESENRFVEGGNFYASHISFSVDRLQNCLATLATWIERFVQYLYAPTENFEFPLMLSPSPGRYAGLSGLGILATHLTAEIRRDSMPASVQSLSSNGGNQDIVPMGAIGVLRNKRTIHSLYELTAILGYSIFQAGYLKGVSLEEYAEFKGLQPLSEDRRLDLELEKIKKQLMEGRDR